MGSASNQQQIQSETFDMASVGKIQDTVVKYRNAILTVVVGLFLVTLAYIGVQQYQSSNEEKAQASYYAVYAKYSKVKEEFDKTNAPRPTAKASEKAAATKTPTGDLEKDYGNIPAELEGVANQYAGNTAGAQAALTAAVIYNEYDQPDKAAAVLSVPAEKQKKNSLMSALVNMSLGNSLATKGDCQEAITAWQKVVENKGSEFLRPDAQVKMGICYETLNQPEKAMEMYRKVGQDAENSSAAQTAKGLLRLLETKQNAAAKG